MSYEKKPFDQKEVDSNIDRWIAGKLGWVAVFAICIILILGGCVTYPECDHLESDELAHHTCVEIEREYRRI